MASLGMMSCTMTVTTTPSSAGSESACPAQRPVVPASVTEERKRKRKESNRLSAQRSRARKQRQLDNLTAQVAAISARNGAMATAAHDAARRCATVQAENKLLRARSLELSARLDSLLELIQYMEAGSVASAVYNPYPFAGTAMHLQPPLLDATMYNYYN